MFNIEINYEDNAWKNIIPEIEKLIQDRCERAIVSTDINKIIDNIEISILLCNDDFIQDLNQQYRNQDKPTNVLSFPNQELEYGQYSADTNPMLGDIVFAYETVKKEAAEQNKTLEDHFSHLIIHGCLHLLGYDHEKVKDANIMEKLEIKTLKEIGIANPY